MGFELPKDAAVADVMPAPEITKVPGILPPEAEVLCINRGNRALTDTFNGEHKQIPPGYFKTTYAAALHFQKRLVVPGTRNVEAMTQQSFIGILGSSDGKVSVDPPEWCLRFAPAELQAFGERVEAIDRGALSNPVDRQVEVVRTTQAQAASPSYGMGGRGKLGIDVSAQASASAAAAVEDVIYGYDAEGRPKTQPAVLSRPETSATKEAEREAAAAGLERPATRRRQV